MTTQPSATKQEALEALGILEAYAEQVPTQEQEPSTLASAQAADSLTKLIKPLREAVEALPDDE